MTTFTRRPSRYLLIGLLVALISTTFQYSVQATPAAIAIVMEVPNYPGKTKLTKGAENSSVKKVQQALIELGYNLNHKSNCCFL
jgi:hypothetical protein